MQTRIVLKDSDGDVLREIDVTPEEKVYSAQLVNRVTEFSDFPESVYLRGVTLTRDQVAAVAKQIYWAESGHDNAEQFLNSVAPRSWDLGEAWHWFSSFVI